MAEAREAADMDDSWSLVSALATAHSGRSARLLPLVEPLTQPGRIPVPTGGFAALGAWGPADPPAVPGVGGPALFASVQLVSEALDCLIPGVGGAELLVVVEPVPVFDREAVALSHRRAAWGVHRSPLGCPVRKSCQGAARSRLGCRYLSSLNSLHCAER